MQKRQKKSMITKNVKKFPSYILFVAKVKMRKKIMNLALKFMGSV